MPIPRKACQLSLEICLTPRVLSLTDFGRADLRPVRIGLYFELRFRSHIDAIANPPRQAYQTKTGCLSNSRTHDPDAGIAAVSSRPTSRARSPQGARVEYQPLTPPARIVSALVGLIQGSRHDGYPGLLVAFAECRTRKCRTRKCRTRKCRTKKWNGQCEVEISIDYRGRNPVSAFLLFCPLAR